MPPAKCETCGRNPQRMNSEVAECSHVECPHRRRAWDEPAHPTGPWPKNTEADPLPLDKDPDFITT